MERDRYGYVEFVGMQSVPVLFNEKPSFSELVARAREEIYCHGDDDITVEGVLHLGCPPNLMRKVIPIGSNGEWENYVRSAMKSQFQSLDVVVGRVLPDPIHHGFSLPLGEQPVADPPAPEPVMDVQVASTVPDAQSAPNEIPIAEAVGLVRRPHVVVAEPLQEVPLTQNHPSKCLMCYVVCMLPLKAIH